MTKNSDILPYNTGLLTKSQFDEENERKENIISLTSSQNVINDDVTKIMPGMNTVVK